MLLETLKKLFLRDLARLRKEIELYKKEENIWLIQNDISNTAGNLCLHLVGNLNTYIGAELGRSGYIRNRELEFSLKNIPREDLLFKIDETIKIVERTLSNLDPGQLNKEYPAIVFAEKTTTEYLLVHLTTHLGYHLGQINYHRRLLDK